MNALAKKWRQDKGSIDFVQVVIGLMIISAASVGTLQALYYGYEQLDYEMRYRKAISIARTYVEEIQGRIHCNFDPNDPAEQQFQAGNLASPIVWRLDVRKPRDIDPSGFDDIFCYVSHGRLIPKDDPLTGTGVDHWRINVFLTWWEPGESPTVPPNQISFEATMVPAAL